jgi:hypothetical protein
MNRVESVHLLNIQHFRRKLAEEADEARRQAIRCLLAREEAKLAALADPPRLERQG